MYWTRLAERARQDDEPRRPRAPRAHAEDAPGYARTDREPRRREDPAAEHRPEPRTAPRPAVPPSTPVRASNPLIAWLGGLNQPPAALLRWFEGVDAELSACLGSLHGTRSRDARLAATIFSEYAASMNLSLAEAAMLIEHAGPSARAALRWLEAQSRGEGLTP